MTSAGTSFGELMRRGHYVEVPGESASEGGSSTGNESRVEGEGEGDGEGKGKQDSSTWGVVI